MTNSVRLPDSLIKSADLAAKQNNSSVEDQLERWAILGREVTRQSPRLEQIDPVRIPSEISQILISNPEEKPEELFAMGQLHIEDLNDHEKKSASDLILSRIAFHKRKDGFLNELQEDPYYEGDPRYPGLVVQVLPDGSRQVGKFEGATFVITEEWKAD